MEGVLHTYASSVTMSALFRSAYVRYVNLKPIPPPALIKKKKKNPPSRISRSGATNFRNTYRIVFVQYICFSSNFCDPCRLFPNASTCSQLPKNSFIAVPQRSYNYMEHVRLPPTSQPHRSRGPLGSPGVLLKLGEKHSHDLRPFKQNHLLLVTLLPCNTADGFGCGTWHKLRFNFDGLDLFEPIGVLKLI